VREGEKRETDRQKERERERERGREKKRRDEIIAAKKIWR
jgi:hypothetical protein